MATVHRMETLGQWLLFALWHDDPTVKGLINRFHTEALAVSAARKESLIHLNYSYQVARAD